MGEGLQMAALATLIGKRDAVRWGGRRVTIGSVGRQCGQCGAGPFVTGTMKDGTLVLGQPSDFTIPQRPKGTPRKGKGKR